MAKNDVFVTLQRVRIDDLWPLGAGSYVYEGCPELLKDGRPCALGKHKRQLRRLDPDSPIGPHARGRATHVCCADGAGIHMFCFAIKIGDNVLQVNEDIGTKMMGMCGQDFKEKVEFDDLEVGKVCDEVRNVVWTIRFARDGRDGGKVVSVHRHHAVKHCVEDA